MFESIKKIFDREPEKEKVELSKEEITSFLREKYSEELEGLEREGKEKVEGILSNIEDMKGALDSLEDADAFQDHQMVKDVKKSFTRQKKNLLDLEEPEFDPEGLRQFIDNLESKFDEFSELTPKQEFVLNKQSEAKSKIYKAFGEAKDSKNELREFIDDKLRLKEDIEEIDSLIESIGSKKEDIEELKGKISQIGQKIERTENNIEKLEEEREDLEKSEKMEEYESLKEKIERAEKEKKEISRKLKGRIADIERVLKKFKHLVDTGERSLADEKLRDLDKLLDKDFIGVNTKELFEQIESSIKLDEVDLKPKKERKFDKVREGNLIENLRDDFISKKRDIKDKKESLENFDSLLEEKEELEERIKEKKEKMEEMKQEVEDKEKRIEELENEIEDREKEIFEKANEISEIYEIRPEN